MLVKFWMTDNVITIDEDVSIVKASKLMKEREIQHLPVVKSSRHGQKDCRQSRR